MTETFWCFSSCLHCVGLFNSHVVNFFFFSRTHNAVVGFLCVLGEGVVWGRGLALIVCHPPTPPPTLKLFWCIAKGLSYLNLSTLASIATVVLLWAAPSVTGLGTHLACLPECWASSDGFVWGYFYLCDFSSLFTKQKWRMKGVLTSIEWESSGWSASKVCFLTDQVHLLWWMEKSCNWQERRCWSLQLQKGGFQTVNRARALRAPVSWRQKVVRCSRSLSRSVIQCQSSILQWFMQQRSLWTNKVSVPQVISGLI